MSEINEATGEVMDAEKVESAIIPVEQSNQDIYAGISRTGVSDEEMKVLLAPPTPDELDVKPPGEIFMAQTFIRRRLNAAFRPGAWAMRALAPAAMQGDQAIQSWGLYVRGNFVAEAVGGAEYQPNNPRLNWSDALESLKSNALMRLCKDLGIASECWDRRFCERFQDEFCVQVWREKGQKPQWRRKDARPFYNETGTVAPKSTQEPRSEHQVYPPIPDTPPTQPGRKQAAPQGTDAEGHSIPEEPLSVLGVITADRDATFTAKSGKRTPKWAIEVTFDDAKEPMKMTTIDMKLVGAAQTARISGELVKVLYKETTWGPTYLGCEPAEPKEA